MIKSTLLHLAVPVEKSKNGFEQNIPFIEKHFVATLNEELMDILSKRKRHRRYHFHKEQKLLKKVVLISTG